MHYSDLLLRELLPPWNHHPFSAEAILPKGCSHTVSKLSSGINTGSFQPETGLSVDDFATEFPIGLAKPFSELHCVSSFHFPSHRCHTPSIVWMLFPPFPAPFLNKSLAYLILLGICLLTDIK